MDKTGLKVGDIIWGINPKDVGDYENCGERDVWKPFYVEKIGRKYIHIGPEKDPTYNRGGYDWIQLDIDNISFEYWTHAHWLKGDFLFFKNTEAYTDYLSKKKILKDLESEFKRIGSFSLKYDIEWKVYKNSYEVDVNFLNALKAFNGGN